MTPAEELRTAAASLRDVRNCANYDLDCDSLELLALIAKLLKAREPLASLLDEAAKALDSHDADDLDHDLAGTESFLAIARAINGVIA